MRSLALRSLTARRGRTVLSILGVALGIGVLYASLATDAGISASIDHTVRELVGRADLRVEAFGPTGLSADSLRAVEDAPGVDVAAPALQKRTYLVPGIDQTQPNPPVTAVGVTPGWLRSERMLENFGVTESNWRDAVEQRPGFAISESPTYVARGVAALAGDPDAGRWSGTILSARQLADAYGVTDIDGSKPDCWGHLAAFGWEHSGGEGIENFR